MRASLCGFALLWLLPACGGDGAAGAPAKSATSEAHGTEQDGKEDTGVPDDDVRDAAGSSDKAKAPSCEDGTCTSCGTGICPVGWYCDEKANACSWLTECAAKPSCSCVTRVLGSGCKCREEGSALKVTCD